MPSYYRGRAFVAWFKLGSIEEEPIETLQSLIYHGFPTLTSGLPGLVSKYIAGPGELSKTEVTLWLVNLSLNQEEDEG